MARRILAVLALIVGLLAIGWALLSPSHMRAIDERVLAEIGKGSPSLVDTGSAFLPERIGSAKLFQEAAAKLSVTNAARFASAMRVVEKNGTAWRTSPFKTANFYELLDPADFQFIGENTFYEIMRNRITREKFKSAVGSPDGQNVLKTLALTNTVLFAPASSAAGIPMEIAVITTGMLIEEKVFSTSLRAGFNQLVASVNPTNSNSALEEFYLNVFTLGRRLNWEQLTAFIGPFQTVASLDFAVRWLQENRADLPTVFSAVVMSQSGEAVAAYLREFPETGVVNLNVALALGAKSLSRLLELREPIYRSALRDQILANSATRGAFNVFLPAAVSSPALAMLIKIVLLIFGAFLISVAWRLYRTQPREAYVWYPRFGLVRQSVFALLFVTALLVIAEPYLAYGESQPEPPRPAFNFALLAQVLNPKPEPTGSMLNPSTIVALVVFFLLQGSIYIICLTKLAEIRRQPLSSAMKLKLLDNEENLFDAGLYAGLFGTALSLVLLTLGVIKPSLVSAYAATLFGILFVAILKIVHVRPYKRRLILETQTEGTPA